MHSAVRDTAVLPVCVVVRVDEQQNTTSLANDALMRKFMVGLYTG